MACRVVWSRRGLRDIEAIADYIAQDPQSNAAAVIRIVGQTKTLARCPHSGRVVPECDDEHIREVSAYSYRGTYGFGGEEVTVAQSYTETNFALTSDSMLPSIAVLQ